MIRRIALVLLASGLLLTACGPSAQVLYYWGGESNGVTEYERASYYTADKQSPESICQMLAMYEKLVSNPGGWRKLPPPGICAEYAWLLIQPETAEMFEKHATARQKSLVGPVSGFSDRSRELFEMEMRYYPESVTFIKPLAEKLFR